MAEEDRPPSVATPPDSDAAPARPSTGIRWLLVLLQLAALCAAFTLIPSGYAYQLGYYFGSLIILGCLVLWTLLYFATTARHLLVCCPLALGQAGLIVAIAFHYTAEDRVLTEVAADGERQKQVWASKMARFNMEPLYQMLSGERPVTPDELNVMNARARGGQAALLAIQAEGRQWEEQAVSRISKVSSQGALDFRKGVESRRTDSEISVQTIQALLSEDEKLTEFLIQREGHYRVAKGVFDFDSTQDTQLFNDHIARVTQLRQKVETLLQNQPEATRLKQPK